MVHILTYESSEIDWCEGNFLHSAHVAEFYNTVFSFLSPTSAYLLSSSFCIGTILSFKCNPDQQCYVLRCGAFDDVPHASVCQGAHLGGACLLAYAHGGIFSAYYHMTLSYLGQLLDEISILWILAVGYSIWFPQPHFPNFIKDRRQFASAVSVGACVTTVMSFAKPTVNAYVLNCVTFHIIYVLVLEMRKCTIPKMHRLAAMSVCWWLLAISCWLSDRLLCGFWRRINFCYLHRFWHVLISITVVHSITLFAYFDAVYEIPQCQPEIRYWPSNRWQFGLPYLAVQSNQKPKKSC